MAENKRHKGHRQRMRERVQSYGLDSLAEHEALEYVLYLTTPKGHQRYRPRPDRSVRGFCGGAWRPVRRNCAP